MIDLRRKLNSSKLTSWLFTVSSFATFANRGGFLNSKSSFFAVALLCAAISFLASTRSLEAAQDDQQTVASEQTNVADAKPSQDSADASKSTAPATVIINATIHTMAGDVLANGRVVIRGGLIEAVGGESLEIPAESEIIDAKNLTITPGWIDLNSQLWMADPPGDAGSSDGSLLATDSLDPFAEDWADVLQAGVTTVYVQPSSAGAMSGLGAAVSVAPGANGSLQIHNPTAGLQMSFGTAPSNRDRAARFEAIKRNLQGVVDYKKKWDDYEKAVKEKEEADKKTETPKQEAAPNQAEPAPRTPGEGVGRGRRGPPGTGAPGSGPPGSGGPGSGPPNSGTPNAGGTPPTADSPSTSKDASGPASTPTTKEEPKKLVKPDKDLVKERLIGVITGKIPVRLEVRNANDVRYAMELKTTFSDVQWVYEGLDQLGSALNDVKKLRAPIVMGPLFSLGIPSKQQAQRTSQLKDLVKGYEGVVAVQTKSNSRIGSRMLREHLAAAEALGVDRDSLLRSVTADAARLIGCDKQLGVLAAGFKADLVGFAGDPLDTTSPVSLVVVDGKLIKQPESAKVLVAATSPSSKSYEALQALAKSSDGFSLKSTNLLLADGLKAGEITVANGKITRLATSADSAAESGAEAIDLGNYFVTPSLGSAYSTLGLDSNTRGTDSDSSHLSANDLSLADQQQLKKIDATGLGLVALTTSSSNTFAGQLSVFSVDRDRSRVVGQVASKIVLTNDARSVDRFPSSLAGQVKFVRDTFEGKRLPSRLYVPDATLSKIDEAKGAVIAKILDQSQLVLFQVNDEAEIEAALRLVRDFKLRAAFFGAKNWAGYASELKESGVAVIALPVRDADYPVYMDDLVTCHRAGVEVYFGGDTGLQIRATASLAVRHGMDPDWARYAVTHGLSKLYPQAAASTGLQTDQSAELLVWSGDPLNLTSKIVARVCNGSVVVNEENE
ncbi:amidohydrolase family protein [Pirellulaceae bacterium SH449]